MKESHWLRVFVTAAFIVGTTASAQEVTPEAKNHYETAMAAKKGGKLEQAARELRAAVELAPKWVDARWALAWTCAGLKNTQRAVDEFNWVIHLAPDSEQAEEAKAAIERLGGEVKPPPGAAQAPADAEKAPEPKAPERPAPAQPGPPGVRTLKHPHQVNSIAFSPDGRTLACAIGWGFHAIIGQRVQVLAKPENQVKLWDVQSGELKRTLTPHPWAVAAVAFSPDGRTLATASIDGTVKLLDPESGDVRQTLTLSAPGGMGPYSTVFSPDGAVLAVAASGEDVPPVQLWDVQTGKLQRALTGATFVPWSVAFSPDGKMLAGSGVVIKPGEAGELDPAAGELCLWDVATGALKAKLTDLQIGLCVSFSPDGRTVAACGGAKEGGVVLFCDVETGEVKERLTGLPGPLTAVAFSPDGKVLATGAATGTVRLLDARTGALKYTLPSERGWSRSMAFSPDGRWLARAVDKIVELWDLRRLPTKQ